MDSIFNITTEAEFNTTALQVFKHQFNSNSVYRSFCDLLYIHPSDVSHYLDIPFLPISFFKTKEVLSSTQKPDIIFYSSGTTGTVTSQHHVTDLSVYETSFLNTFKTEYGAVNKWAVLALLPSYLEREGSSLVYMADALIKKSKHPKSGFYLDGFNALYNTLLELEKNKQPTLLLGVTFALLDFIERYTLNLKYTTVMETGGMKGRRKELIRDELHHRLKSGFGVNQIHSEYGMTELLSQAYSRGNGLFKPPNWMRVITRDTEDALTLHKTKKTGGLNIIDLANYNSCSFIATQDLGSVNPDGTFEVLGRFDNSDIRGCSLLSL